MIVSAESELAEVAERYARRAELPSDRYSMLNPSVYMAVQERARVLLRLLTRLAPCPVEQLRALEVGCGSGVNLAELLSFGFNAENLSGVELLPERVEEARRRLPPGCAIAQGDAMRLEVAPDSQDIVYQSTVFSSILDRDFRQALARTMWRWVRPGGAIVWYDFVYDNPSNPDVTGIGAGEIGALFPRGQVFKRRVTLAPPISRRLCPLHPSFYTVLNAVPLLRTHLLCWIGKPF